MLLAGVNTTPEESEAEIHVSMAHAGAAFRVPPEWGREPRVGLAALPGTCCSLTLLHHPAGPALPVLTLQVSLSHPKPPREESPEQKPPPVSVRGNFSNLAL